MRSTKLILILACFILSVSNLKAQSLNVSYLSYINQYSDIAQKQQREYGIPASIILAQGLLESGAGRGTLAKKSNNHFGIKCADWKGDKVYHNDDAEGECFRKYDNVLDSYRDHSIFLKTRNRYAFLFELKSSDYEGWAFGLKKAGYATDPTYAYKLISIVENYELHKYDLGKKTHLPKQNETTQSVALVENKTSNNSMGSIDAYTKHQVMKVNGVLFITSIDGDTYATIADEFNLSEQKIRKYNDLASTEELTAGKRVFIAQKKKKAPKECKSHVIVQGETMLSISQDYAIRIIDLYKLNKMSFDQGAVVGTELKLR